MADPFLTFYNDDHGATAIYALGEPMRREGWLYTPQRCGDSDDSVWLRKGLRGRKYFAAGALKGPSSTSLLSVLCLSCVLCLSSIFTSITYPLGQIGALNGTS